MTEKKAADFNFEASLQELEAVVKSMEEGNLSLEDSLKCFEKGVTLTRKCQVALKEAEQKVQILSGNGVEATLQNYKIAKEDTTHDADLL